MPDSWWLAEDAPPLRSARLDDPVDVAIVGAGVTGCSCALTLARGGLRVRVYEARTVASGASGRNGGFALRGGAPPYDRARADLGAERARLLWAFTERALGRIAELAGDAFRPEGSLRLAADATERAELEAEFAALREDGFAAEWLDDLPPPLAGRFFGAIRHPLDGALQPAQWVRRLAASAAEAGVEIRERGRVEDVDELPAERVVVATDGYGGSLLPELARVVTPVRGQVIVTEPLGQRLFPCPHYSRGGYDYWHQPPDLRLVLGGRRDTAADFEFTDEEATTPEIQSALESFARELVGFEPAVEARWAGIWGRTPDQYPLAGPLPGQDRIWVATGYSGHGNVLGFACGDLVARALLGDEQTELELFDPSRLV
ncbi:MAG: FAD-binding oxidoreductase [Actinomycetota bacterium]|nr:FAD-binding oxidoreductase [Actinomycetota bacterium]